MGTQTNIKNSESGFAGIPMNTDESLEILSMKKY